MQTVNKSRFEIITHHGRPTTSPCILAVWALTAVPSASTEGAARKWNVVPPAISIDGRVVWVRTKAGQWKGGHLIRPSDPIFGQTD